jgi:group I intron endonuclease
MIIYKTTNLINGKFYVGKDALNVKSYLGSGKLLKYAITKYGKENFKKEILEVCTKENINEREQYWIKELDARNKKIGYNINVGGDGGGTGPDNPMFGKHPSPERLKQQSEMMSGEGNPFFGRVHSDETKAKISDAHKVENLSEETRKRISDAQKGKKMSEVSKEKISEAMSGENNPMYGKSGELSPNFGIPASEERKAKISRANTGKVRSEEVKKHLSEINMGKHASDEARRKMSEARKGKSFSEEHKQKIAEAKREYWHKKHLEENPNYDIDILKPKIDKRTIPRTGPQCYQYGKPMAEETKAKISAKLKGRKMSEEWVEKLRARVKGVKKTEEQRKRVSEGLKRYYENKRQQENKENQEELQIDSPEYFSVLLSEVA